MEEWSRKGDVEEWSRKGPVEEWSRKGPVEEWSRKGPVEEWSRKGPVEEWSRKGPVEEWSRKGPVEEWSRKGPVEEWSRKGPVEIIDSTEGALSAGHDCEKRRSSIGIDCPIVHGTGSEPEHAYGWIEFATSPVWSHPDSAPLGEIEHLPDEPLLSSATSTI
ncbi:hypothetical protein MMC24_004357 [Lignoscripta atroalba]|nr:hypothetical protein [Lignoscripta atroalba]